MYKIAALIAFLWSSCMACAGYELPRPLSTEEISERFELALSGTVALIGDDGGAFCSGSWISDDTILTARHCVDGGESQFRVGAYWDYDYETNIWRNTYAFELHAVSETDDVALLRQMPPLERVPHANLPILPRRPLIGERVFAIGAPMGFGYFHSEGRVIAPLRIGALGPEDRWTQHSAVTHPGMSGGPVLTEDGQILCVTSFIIWRKPTLAGCVHIEAIHELLQEH